MPDVVDNSFRYMYTPRPGLGKSRRGVRGDQCLVYFFVLFPPHFGEGQGGVAANKPPSDSPNKWGENPCQPIFHV
jgi:hypothetical protein